MRQNDVHNYYLNSMQKAHSNSYTQRVETQNCQQKRNRELAKLVQEDCDFPITLIQGCREAERARDNTSAGALRHFKLHRDIP